MYTLYLKTHLSTGMKYLGVTSQDAIKYKGSGKYWRSHLKKHGNDVKTEILYQTLCEVELTFWGLEFSKTFDIVNSNNFANLKEETGYTAYSPTSSPSEKQISAWRNNILKAIEWQTGRKRDDKFRNAVSEAVTKSWKKRRLDGKHQWKHTDESKLNHSKGAKSRWSSPEQRELQSKRIKENWIRRKLGGH